MPRIPLFPLDTMTDAQRAAYDKASGGPGGPIKGPTRAVLHNVELADKWRGLGDLLRHGTSLPLGLSELAILVTARRWTAQFVFNTHIAPALKGGIPQAAVDAIREDRRPQLANESEAAVYDYSATLAETGSVSDAQHRRALAAVGTTGLVELTAIVGYYSMVAMTVNAHEVLPEGALPLGPRRTG